MTDKEFIDRLQACLAFWGVTLDHMDEASIEVCEVLHRAGYIRVNNYKPKQETIK